MIARVIVLASYVAGCASTPETLLELGAYECRPMSAAAAAAIPPPLPEGVERASEPVVQACPEGYVPYYESVPRAPRRPTTSQVSGAKYYYAGVLKQTPAIGVHGRILITAPTIVFSGDHTTSEISIVQNQPCSDPPHTNHELVETGYRRLFGQPTRLLIGQWFACSFWGDDNFERTHATYAPEMDLTSYVGTAVHFHIQRFDNDWWVYFKDGWVGYFPQTPYFIFPSGQTVHYYGEVVSLADNVPPRTDMGNGQHAASATAAYIDNMSYNNLNGNSVALANSLASVTDASLYSFYRVNGTSIRHGGPGATCPAPYNLCGELCLLGACP